MRFRAVVAEIGGYCYTHLVYIFGFVGGKKELACLDE